MTEGIVAASSETSSAPDDCLAGEPKSASGERERSPPAAAFSESVRVSHDGEGAQAARCPPRGRRIHRRRTRPTRPREVASWRPDPRSPFNKTRYSRRRGARTRRHKSRRARNRVSPIGTRERSIGMRASVEPRGEVPCARRCAGSRPAMLTCRLIRRVSNDDRPRWSDGEMRPFKNQQQRCHPRTHGRARAIRPTRVDPSTRAEVLHAPRVRTRTGTLARRVRRRDLRTSGKPPSSGCQDSHHAAARGLPVPEPARRVPRASVAGARLRHRHRVHESATDARHGLHVPRQDRRPHRARHPLRRRLPHLHRRAGAVLRLPREPPRPRKSGRHHPPPPRRGQAVERPPAVHRESGRPSGRRRRRPDGRGAGFFFDGDDDASDDPYQQSSNGYTFDVAKDGAQLARLRKHWMDIGGAAALDSGFTIAIQAIRYSENYDLHVRVLDVVERGREGDPHRVGRQRRASVPSWMENEQHGGRRGLAESGGERDDRARGDVFRSLRRGPAAHGGGVGGVSGAPRRRPEDRHRLSRGDAPV